MTARDEGRALSFGTVAEDYERHRRGYPDEVLDLVLGHARRPVRRALEVGAGTGKATRLVAGRGIAVTGLEPDPAMARVLATATARLPVRLLVSSFEAFTGPGHFDLLYAAASWHWTDPATRWSRAVELLAPGGVLALFGRPVDLVDPDLVAALEALEAELLPGRHRGSTAPWSAEDARAAEGLADVVEHSLEIRETVPAGELVQHLATLSAYLALPPPARAEALDRVRALLPERVEIDTSVRLLLACRT